MAEKIARQKKGEQNPHVRTGNFGEVTYNYTPEQAKLEASRCIQCKKPLCVEGCPVNVKIPQFIKKITEGDLAGGYATIKEDNFLPAVCGRVCPQESQCEGRCILGKKGDPVAIGNLERFLADTAMADAKSAATQITENGKKVAVVGSGPAGLTCAAELRVKGYSVTVFEAFHVAGGVLVYGIPEFRLPKSIVRTEIESLKAMGVEFKLNYLIGKTLTVDDIFAKGYKAVFIASGAGYPGFMNIPGEDFNGIYSANEYLTRINLMKAYDPEADTPVRRGDKVAVIGAGNVAMDAARCARRMGAGKVYIIYRRGREEMPARKEEIEHAEEEGIEFLLLNSPIEYKGDENGFLKSAVIQRMELGEPDASGRRSPVPVKGSEYELELDAAIVAVGTHANPVIADTTPNLEVNRKGYIVTNDDGLTSREAVYAGGDIVSGAATVILAMGAGKRAAKAIDEKLSK